MPRIRSSIQNLVHRFQPPRFRLNLILATPFVVQIALAVGVTGYISLYSGQSSVNQVATQLQNEITQRIQRELSIHLKTAEIVNQTNVNGLETGALNVQPFSSLENHLHRQLQQFPAIASITIASEKPDYIGIRSNQEDRSSLYLSVWNPNETGKLDWLIDSQGNRKLLRQDRTYDHRIYSWYHNALKTKQPVWNDVYVKTTPANLVISASQPFYDPQGNPLGVVSTDLTLAAFSQLLGKLKIGQTGEAFILDRNGRLIATSTDQPLLKTNGSNSGAERLQAIESSNSLISATAKHLLSRSNGLYRIAHQEQTDFTINHQHLFIQVAPFEEKQGLDWLVIVVIPESDFTAQLQNNKATTLLVCLAALAVAIGLSILTARWISRPILRLHQASRSIAQGHFDQRIDTQIPVVEFAAMARSFNQMAERMDQSFQQIEVALSESESKFTKVFRFTPDPIAITTFGEGKFITVNDSFLDWYGFSREEVIGYTCQQLHLWPNLEDYRTLVRILTEKGLVRNLEVMHRTKAGEVRTILLSAEIADLDGQTCVISSIKNISERKQVEAALRQAKEAADAANKAKSEFLTNMSHELRTPLNAILGFSDLMKDDPTLVQEQRENLNIIHHSGEYLLGLINDVLDLSKIEAGKILLQEESFELYHLLASLEAMMQLKAKSKGLELIFLIADDIPQVIYADEGKLRQILINLLGNATKFTDSGNVILRVNRTSKATTQPDPFEGKEADCPSNLLLIEVEDTGPGISDADLRTLFQPFTQTETGKLKQGTGLGLSISRKLLELMGGTITVSSSLGQGTLFRITLPIKPIHRTDHLQNQAAQRVVGITPQQITYRILIADDVRENRLLLTKMLIPLGFEVLEAENGQEAIDLWQIHQPHLICMDIRMPIIDGYEATRQIKATPQGKSTIILAITASAMEEHQMLAFAAGCDDFIDKPVKKDVLLTKIATCLSLSYVYEAMEPLTVNGLTDSSWADQSDCNHQAALAAMPSDWRSALHFAAASCDVAQVELLIAQIPDTQAPLACYLKGLARQFRFDQIRELSR